MEDAKYQNLVIAVVNSAVVDSKSPGTVAELRRQCKALRKQYPLLHVGGTVPIWGYRWQEKLQRVWELASDGKKQDAIYRVDEMRLEYASKLRGWREDPSLYHYAEREKAFVYMLGTLEWLRTRVGSMKVCNNPKCNTQNRYFFRIYSNDRYCCIPCVSKAKELRREQREREDLMPPKQYVRSEASRTKMSIRATERWTRERAKMGRPK